MYYTCVPHGQTAIVYPTNKETHRVIAGKPFTMRPTVSENPPHRAVFCTQILTLETFGVNNLACWTGGRTWCYR